MAESVSIDSLDGWIFECHNADRIIDHLVFVCREDFSEVSKSTSCGACSFRGTCCVVDT